MFGSKLYFRTFAISNIMKTRKRMNPAKLMLSIAMTAISLTAPTADASEAAILSPDGINDLALLYIGSNHRSKWDKEILRPYVVHTYPDGHSSWMFDGFLMVEFVLFSEDGSQSFSIDGDWPYGTPAMKSHWEYMLEHQLGLESNTGCKAIDELITELTPELGAPSRKHKVVMSVPVPTKATQVWGKIDGKNMNFELVEDRITAINWYVDHVVEKWNKAGFKNLELAGIYWTQEAPEYGGATGNMATAVNKHAHELGLKTYWIPYFSVASRSKWAEMGFDVAYTQPNYAFTTTVPYTQLEEAVESSFELGLGVEMEMEGYNFTNVNGTIQKSPAPSCGLYDISPVFWGRVKDYIDVFESHEAFGFLPVAYYAGYQAFYDYETSGNPRDKELMDRMASIMEHRHIVTEWYEPKQAGIDEIVNDSDIAYGGDGYIYIDDRAGNAAIYSLDGRCIYNGSTAGQAGTERLSYGISVSCLPGVYLVRSGAKTVKVLVK